MQTARFSLTVDDQLEATRLMRQSKGFSIPVIWVFVVFPMAFAAAGMGLRDVINWTFLAAIALLLVLWTVSKIFPNHRDTIERQFQEMGVNAIEIEAVVTSESYSQSSGDGQQILPWSKLFSYQANEKLILLYRHSASAYVLPVDQLSPQFADAVLHYAKTAIENRKSTAQFRA